MITSGPVPRGVPDDVPDLLLVPGQRLGGKDRHDNLAGLRRPQAPIRLGCHLVKNDPPGREARRRVCAQVLIHRAAAWQLHDHNGIACHSAASLLAASSGSTDNLR